jgi:hypothetical protein
MEVLAWQILEGVTISSYSSGARYVFDKGRDTITKKNADPAGYGGDVGWYIGTASQVENAKSRFTTAFNRATKAEAFERDGNIEDAVGEWRKIFGSAFPAYG